MDSTDLRIFSANACYVPGEFRNPVFHGSYSFNTGRIKKLTTSDYTIFVTVLSATMVIGFYHAWRNRTQETLEEFLLAFRLLPGVPVALSSAATFVTGITIIGTFIEVYVHGVMYLWSSFGIFMMAVLSAEIYQPLLYRLNLTTCNQYLEMRFGKVVRSTAAAIYIFNLLFYNSIVFLAPTLALKEVMGLTLWGSIFLMAFICIAITAFGGIQSIIAADVFILSIIFLSILVVLGRAMQVTDSWESVWESNKRSHRLVFDEVRLESGIRHSIWTVVIGSFFTAGSLTTTAQQFVQKTFCCSTLRNVKIAVYLSMFIHILSAFLISLLALYGGAFYENCDPLDGKLVLRRLDILPLFVMDILSDTYGLAGLFAAGLFLSSLSTNTSCFNAVSTMIMQDFIMNYGHHDMTDFQTKRMAQLIVLVYGLFIVLGTYIAESLWNVLEAVFVIAGLLGSSVFGVFTLGMFFPWANTQGAISGMFGSEMAVLGIFVLTSRSGSADIKPIQCISNCNPNVFGNITRADEVMPERFEISYMLYPMMNTVFSIFIGLLVSFATGAQETSELDPDLYVCVCDEIFPFYYLPESVRKRFRPAQPNLADHCSFHPSVISLGTFSPLPVSCQQSQVSTEVDTVEK